MTGRARPTVLGRIRSSPVALAGVLLMLAGVLTLLPSALPGNVVAGRVGVVLVAALLAGAALVMTVPPRGMRRDRDRDRARSRDRDRSRDRVAMVAGIVFAAATLLKPLTRWVAPNAPAPTAEMYIASAAALILTVIAWGAGLVALIALFRAGTLRRPAFLPAAIAFGIVGVMAVVLLLVTNLAPDAPQDVLVPLWGAQGALAPVLLIVTGASWVAVRPS
jgi:hypothetical protein